VTSDNDTVSAPVPATESENDKKLIEIRNLKTYFTMHEGMVRAVDGADFDIHYGQTLGVVGESGCGKSVTAQSVLRIVPPPGRIVDGEILFHRTVENSGDREATETVDLAQLDPRGREIRAIRGAEIAMVFQEPMTSLSPVHTIGNQIVESITLHQNLDKTQARERAIEMLDRVGMPRPHQTIDSYPYQLSGGMRQRGVIAMALSCHPSLLIADEPTTALDVTTEAQILDLMRDLQQDLGMAIMFITHNLGVIAEMSEEVIVMYLGKVVEQADVDSLFHDPKHPYTRALLRSIPRVDQDSDEPLESIKGTVPDPYALPEGCPFHPRCPSVMQGTCDLQDPPFILLGGNKRVRCHLYT
jgi:peptide/nickel transport system ATP-binding protein